MGNNILINFLLPLLWIYFPVFQGKRNAVGIGGNQEGVVVEIIRDAFRLRGMSLLKNPFYIWMIFGAIFWYSENA